MSERLNHSSDKSVDGEEVYVNPADIPATPEQINLAEEFVRQAGANPDEVAYSIHITSEQNERGVVQKPTSGWIKSPPPKERPNSATSIDELLVRRAPNVIIRPSRRVRPGRVTEQETLVFGDAQVPFGDPRAMELARIAVRELMPTNIVFVGDMIDLPGQSKYSQHPSWANSTQSSLDELHGFYAQMRADSPDSNIYVVHGNHEQRLNDYVQRNAAEVLGLRRANKQQELAVLTLQNLLCYDELEIKSIDGYPNGELWLEDNLKFVHGTNAKKGGINAAKYLAEEPVTTVYGHSHRQELAYKTIALRDGASNTIAAASPGSLCMIDGTVPGFNHTFDAQGGVVKKAEDWQQGLLQVRHEGAYHEITPVRFSDRGMILNGKRYSVTAESLEYAQAS